MKKKDWVTYLVLEAETAIVYLTVTACYRREVVKHIGSLYDLTTKLC
jgi:hypothetical protein